jgi:hypothetical protein
MILQGLTLRDINETRGQPQLNYFKMKSTFHARIEVFGWLAAVRRVCFERLVGSRRPLVVLARVPTSAQP